MEKKGVYLQKKGVYLQKKGVYLQKVGVYLQNRGTCICKRRPFLWKRRAFICKRMPCVCAGYPLADHQHFPKGQFCLLAFLSLDRSFVSSMSPLLTPTFSQTTKRCQYFLTGLTVPFLWSKLFSGLSLAC